MSNNWHLRQWRISLLISITMSMLTPASASWGEDKVFLLSDEQWNVPRTEQTILAMPALQSVIESYQATGDSGRLLIKYPGGDEGTLWASELRGWLVSLGIASRNIELVPGAKKVNQLEMYVISTQGQR